MARENIGVMLAAVRKAITWLESLTDLDSTDITEPSRSAVRIYSAEECEAIPLKSRSYLLILEQQGLLSALLREKIIHHVMELDIKDLDIQVIEGIAKIVLGDQTEKEEIMQRLEMILPEEMGSVH